MDTKVARQITFNIANQTPIKLEDGDKSFDQVDQAVGGLHDQDSNQDDEQEIDE